jgi:hypothetical protein
LKKHPPNYDKLEGFGAEVELPVDSNAPHLAIVLNAGKRYRVLDRLHPSLDAVAGQFDSGRSLLPTVVVGRGSWQCLGETELKSIVVEKLGYVFDYDILNKIVWLSVFQAVHFFYSKIWTIDLDYWF